MYGILIKPFVRRMNPEKASRVALQYFKIVGKIPGGRFLSRFFLYDNRASKLQREVFGLNFYNPLGLGAGLDRKGELYNDLNDLGFSFSEIGPLDAKGIRKALKKIQEDPQNDILAACINRDYLTAFTLAYDFCDFFVIEINSDTGTEDLDPLLDARLTNDVYKPIVIKLPEGYPEDETEDIVKYCMLNGFDGIQARSLEQIRTIRKISAGRLPIMANARITTPKQAYDMLEAGASLIEVRSGLVYEGPSLIGKMLKYLESHIPEENGGIQN